MTRWPWVLRANSQLLKVWNVIVLVVVIYVAILYPYLAAFTHIDILNKAVTTDTVFVIYLIDVVIQMFTSIESKTGTKYFGSYYNGWCVSHLVAHMFLETPNYWQ